MIPDSGMHGYPTVRRVTVGGAVQIFRLHLGAWRLTYVTAFAVLLAAAALAPQWAQAQTENQLYSFKNGPTDGQFTIRGRNP